MMSNLRILKSFILASLVIFPPASRRMPVRAKPRCANIKNRRFTQEQCPYSASRGEFCSRHSKNPRRFEVALAIPPATRSIQGAVKKIQRWWKLWNGLKSARLRGFAFFSRDLCHNNTELASFEPIQTISRVYFFAINDNKRIWGFDIRYLIMKYEIDGFLENPYTKEILNTEIVGEFRKRVEYLRRWKISMQFEQVSGLTPKQSWNLRVLDMCLRLDMLGYRVATQWFTDLEIVDQRKLYAILYAIWNDGLNLTNEQKNLIVPQYNESASRLFKWIPTKIIMCSDLDSIRRTNLNVMERLISSAIQQSDRTLGAMYTVMGLSQVSYRCRSAYPWLII